MLTRGAQAVGAWIALLTMIVAVPVGLVRWGRWPITGLPTVDQVRELPATIATETALFGVTTLVAWVFWALFVVSVLVEVASEVRGQQLRAVPLAGPLQRLAQQLVAVALLSVSVTGVARRPAPADSASRPGPGQLPVAGGSGTASWEDAPVHRRRPPTFDYRTGGAPPSPEGVAGAAAGPAAAMAPTGAGAGAAADQGESRSDVKLVVVGADDSPWSLAEEHLGDGMRWRDLYAANRERQQPDGGMWTDPEDLRPGWQLVIPTGFGRVTGEGPVARGQGLGSGAATESASSPQPEPPASGEAARPASGTSDSTGALGGGGRLASGGAHIVERVDLLNRSLSHDLRSHGPVDVAGMRVTATGMEVLLGAASPPPLGYKPAGQDGTVWQPAPRVDETNPGGAIPSGVPLLPALVTVGAMPAGLLLLDLEQMGVLAVEGEQVAVQRWLNGVARQLAAAPWSGDAPLRFAGMPAPTAPATPESGRPGDGQRDIEVVPGAAALVSGARVHAGQLKEAVDDATPMWARIQLGQAAPPMVIVVAGPVPTELVALCAQPQTGLVLVATGPIAGAPWRLVIDRSSDAVLHPWGVRLRCSPDDLTRPAVASPGVRLPGATSAPLPAT